MRELQRVNKLKEWGFMNLSGVLIGIIVERVGIYESGVLND
jgi:hypothetical protein